ncbi:radical SAM/SPASM domain-containing protein [Ruminiclostridium josui]|uniref:radical SAM/SPASM domain-containing protein n=2 Tax=Ruminiclostridium josui TaxID=1499 RepID=UPI000464E7B7|nr:radical SAM protein [Ruminiclostridium josui]
MNNSVVELNNVYITKRLDRFLVVSSEFGTWITCNEDTVNILETFRNKKTFNAVFEKANIPREILISRIKEYFEKGLLKIDGRNRFNSIDVNSMVLKANPSPQLCILHVSNICNLSCKYCYAHTDKSEKSTMSLDVMQKSIDRFMELPTNSLTIEFHGGEPLMQYRKIALACEYANNLKNKYNKSVTFAMQSNMTFLNDEILDMLKKYKILIRISLDGLKDMNDNYRVDKEGRGSFDKIVNNTQTLVKNGIRPEVVSVVTKKNVDYLREIFEFFSSINLKRVRLMPFWVQGMGKEIDDDVVEPEYLADKYLELIAWIADHNRKIEDRNDHIKMLVLSKELEALHTFKRSFMCLRCPCGAGINMVDVSINGDIYPCEEMNEIAEFKIGNIRTHSIMDVLNNSKVVKELSERNPDNIEDCSVCAWKRHCQSGCANKNYQNFGSFETKSEKCQFYKKYFENLIWYLDSNRDALKYLV